MPTYKGLFTTNRAYTALLRNTWVSTQYNVPVYQTDPYFNYTTILLSGDTFNTKTFNSDASVNNYNITITGNVSASKLTPYGNIWSNYFDGTGDYLTVPGNAAFAMGTGDFTCEVWFYATRISTGTFDRICATSDYNGSGFDWTLNTNASAFYLAGTAYNIGSITIGVWHHLVYTRSGSVIRGFLNGNLSSYTTGATQNISSTAQLNIGAGYSGTALNGYITNLRIIKGSIPAAYQTSSITTGTQIFTPPTTPLTVISGTSLLTCQNNRFIDNSTNNFTITQVGDAAVTNFNPFDTVSSYSNYGSGAFFTGQTNYATFPAEVLTGDFTIEAWVYYTATSSYGAIVSTNSSSLELLIQANGAVIYYTGGSFRIGTTIGVNKNSWNHIALVRNGGVAKIYINGVVDVATYASSASIGAAGEFYYIARDPGASAGYTGYYSDIRIIKGTAVYTGNFTPPVAPLQVESVSASYPNTANINYSPAANTSVLTMQYKQPHNNHTFFDSSNQNIYPIIRTGNSTQGSFSPYGTRWSAYFDGSGDYIRKSGSGVLAASSGDVTIECWIYPTSTSVIGLFDGGSGEGEILRNFPANTIARQVNEATGATFTVTANQWQHFACTYAAGVIKVYINGILNGSGTYSSTYNTGSNFDIGVINSGGNGSFAGYISNFRVTKSLVYTTNFTPSTSPLTALANTSLLTCQSNRFIDNSANNYTLTKTGDITIQNFSPFLPTANASPTVTGGSVYFDGTGDYLTISSQTLWTIPTGTTPLTVEVWVYPTSTTPGTIITEQYTGSGNPISYTLSLGQGVGDASVTNKVWFGYYNGSGWGGALSASTLPLNAWSHIAGVFTGSQIRIYINGVLDGSPVSSTDWQTASSSIGYIGVNWGTDAARFSGYMSDLRVVKGQALYTGNFTLPTAPLQLAGNAAIYTSTANVNTTFAAANTSLLMNFTDAGITDATTLNNIETLGDAKVATANSVFGGSAMFFDGTGDYLKIPDSENFTYGSNNFTIESWIYPMQTGDRRFYTHYQDGSNQFLIRLNNSTNRISATASQGGSTLFSNTSTTAVTLNTWSHVAVVRNGNGITTYLNGANVGASAYSGALGNYAAPLLISSYDGTNEHFLGYIDDFRITKGIARYTGNFTVSANAAPLR